ncbi:MAG: cysteine hydrolase family protein [Alphaproteobacteria bacterium]|nr:cysteine hydrolase family protein [Alphaproteobacteria bacterium]MCZ6861977.1 cysteine hydrolase family protein [Alphaproteobacteria bacterium]
MSEPKTLLQLAGADLEPAKLNGASLILIDMQYEYLEGPIAVTDAAAAIAHAKSLLENAREAGSPVIHVAHKGRAGSLFDRDAKRGQIVDELAPMAGEITVEKSLPNAFAGTQLQAQISNTDSGRNDLILCGFMTHMCVSSTARAALDLGYRVTIDADSCGTRDLPDGRGSVIEASTLHNVALVELSDRFAVIARDHRWLE